MDKETQTVDPNISLSHMVSLDKISGLSKEYNKAKDELRQRKLELKEIVKPLEKQRLSLVLTEEEIEQFTEAYNNFEYPNIDEQIKDIQDEETKIKEIINNKNKAYEELIKTAKVITDNIYSRMKANELDILKALKEILASISNADFELFKIEADQTYTELAHADKKLSYLIKDLKALNEQIKNVREAEPELAFDLERIQKEISKIQELETRHREFTEKYGLHFNFENFCKYLYQNTAIHFVLNVLREHNKVKLKQARLEISTTAGKFITPEGEIIFIPEVKEKESKEAKEVSNYSMLLQGTATNMFGLFNTKDFTELNKVTNTRTATHGDYALSLLDKSFSLEQIKRNDELDANDPNRISKNQILVNQFKFDDTTTMIFDAICEAFTQQIRPYTQITDTGRQQKKEYSAEELEEARRVNITVKNYKKLRGLADTKKIKEELKRAMGLLQFASGSFDEPVVTEYTDRAGRTRHRTEIKHWTLNYFEKKSELTVTGDMDMYLTPTFAGYLATKYIMPMDNRLYSLQGKVGTKAYNMGKKILEHYNMNIGKHNANKINVSTLLEYTDLPTYEELKKSGHIKASEKIIYPFQDRLNALEDIGVIKSWEYMTQDEEPPIEIDYRTFIKSLIVFEISPEYPDQTKRLEAKERKIQEAQKRKQKAINKNMNKKQKEDAEL